MSLVLTDVAVRFGDFQFGPLNLAVHDEISCLIGPNGAGKSTLLRCCTGATEFSGSITWGRREIGQGRPSDWVGVSYVADTWTKIFDWLTPAEYWRTIAQIRTRDDRGDHTLQKQLESAFTLQDEFAGIDASKPCRELSFGSRRKVQIIGGLMSEPELFLVDEPQNGLDFLAAETLSQILLRERHKRGMVVLLASHDLGSVAAISDSIHVMRGGNLVGRLGGNASGQSLRCELARVLRQAI